MGTYGVKIHYYFWNNRLIVGGNAERMAVSVEFHKKKGIAILLSVTRHNVAGNSVRSVDKRVTDKLLNDVSNC